MDGSSSTPNRVQESSVYSNASAGVIAPLRIKARREALGRFIEAEREKARQEERERIAGELEKLRDELYGKQGWSVKKAMLTFAAMHVRKYQNPTKPGETSEESRASGNSSSDAADGLSV